MEGEALPPVSGTQEDSTWSYVHRLLNHQTPFCTENFEPGEEIKEFLKNDLRVLCVGAGGLGCELLKDIALMSIGNIDVIDMDTIEITNLNRQFLFRMHDVGQPKASVAARFINETVPGAKVIPHVSRIQDKPAEFYKQFHIIVLGLDSLEARRWINDMICSFAEYEEDGSLIEHTSVPIVDGGTEAFKGHARVIFPGKTACFECTLGMFPPQEKFPLCTLADVPRNPAHCVEWAKLIAWEQERPDDDLDLDDPKHMQWLFQRAKERADEFGITGVTLQTTQGVAKNIIPAIASTNAIVAAACALEVFKIATGCASALKDYTMYNGSTGVYTHTFVSERLKDCAVCANRKIDVTIDPRHTLTQVIEQWKQHPSLLLVNPSIVSKEKTLYMVAPEQLEQMTRPNLNQAIGNLVQSGDVLSVTDPSKATGIQIRVTLSAPPQ